MSLKLEQNRNIEWANPPAWVIISLKHAPTQKPSTAAFLSYIFISFEQLKAIVYQSESIYPTFHSFLYLAHPSQQMIWPKATGSILRTDKTFISSENKRTKATRIGQCGLRFTSYVFGCKPYHQYFSRNTVRWNIQMFLFVSIIGYVPYWHFYKTCHITSTIHSSRVCSD